MRFSLRKYIANGLIFTLLATRVLIFVPYVSALPSMPSAPGAPSMPTQNSAPPPPPPSMPSQNQELPAAPTMPSADNSSVPTSPPLPTSDTSIISVAPTDLPLPTQQGSQVSPTVDVSPSDTQSGSSADGLTQNQSEDDASGGSGSSSPSVTPTDSASKSSSGDVNDPANTHTGSGSENNAYEKLNAEMEKLNENLAQLQNKIDAATKTGFNYANLNTLGGNVFSGNATTQLNLLNKLNSNLSGTGDFKVFNIYDTYIGDIIFKMGDSLNDSFNNASATVSQNAATGANSTNNAVAENNFEVKEANGNDAKIENDINLSAVSGGNTASFNTGSGNVTTGDASVVGNIINLTNTNLNVSKWLFGIVNIWGTLVGDIILPKEAASTSNTTPAVYTGNTDTGPLSTNNASYTSNNTASFENHNEAVIESSIDTSANTGNNTSSANTGGGNISTGNGNIAVSDSTVANVNTDNSEETVWMIIVNEAGKWVGHILGEPWGATSASNNLPVSQGGNGATQTPAFTTLAENSATGPGSYNNSSYSENNESVTINDNKASITNNITASADTGNNEAIFNTGAGNINTGDANVGLNLVNMANTNVKAKKFITILVNVLGGDFWGNIVPPQTDSLPDAETILPPEEIINPIVSPTPTAYLPPIGDTGVILPTLTPIPTIPPVVSAQATTAPIQYANYQINYQFNQAVSRVNNQKKKVIAQQNQLKYNNNQKIQTAVNNKYTRGIFLSPAFAKAVESSFPGMLFGGVSLKVNQNWLSIIPFAIFLVILRRRKRLNLSNTISNIIEKIL